MASDSEASCVSDPNFAVICSFLEKFGASCGITSPDFLQLQEMLENTQELSQELIDIHIKLLRRIKRSVSADRWERVLIKVCHTYCSQDAWELERFGYRKARLSSKLRILKQLLEMQFDFHQKFKTEVNRLTASELRTEPIGRDKHGHAYWYQIDEHCQMRVYREDPDEETWVLVATNREGLVRLISQLASDDPNLADIVLNEDSNSLEIEKPILDTGQTSSSTSNCEAEVDESSGGNDVSSEPQTETSPVETSATENTTPAEEKPEIENHPKINKLKITLSSVTTTTHKPEQHSEELEAPVISTVKNEEKMKSEDKSEKPVGINLSVPQSSIPITTKGVDLTSKRKKSINDLAVNLRLKSHDLLYKNPVQEQEMDLSVKKPRMDPKQFSSLSVPPFEPMSIESALRMSAEFADDEEMDDEDEDEDEFFDEDEISLPSHMKQPRLDRPTLLGNTKKKTYSDEEDDEEYGEEIEEPVMLIQGEGSGRDCENENIRINMSGDYSEAVEEPVMYFYGEGSGFDCDTGNTGKEEDTSSDGKSNDTKDSASSEVVESNINESDLNTIKGNESASNSSSEVLTLVGEQKTEQSLEKHVMDCDSKDVKSDSVVNRSKDASPKCQKIGTIMIDVKSVNRGQMSPKKNSRWDIGKPVETSSIQIVKNIDYSTEKELCDDSTNSSIKINENSDFNPLTTSQDETDNTISDISVTDIETSVNKLKDGEKQEIRLKNIEAADTAVNTQEALTDHKTSESDEKKKQPMFFFGPGCFQFKAPQLPSSKIKDIKGTDAAHNSVKIQNINDQANKTKTETLSSLSDRVPTHINKADILINKEQITVMKTNVSSEITAAHDTKKRDDNTKENILEKQLCAETKNTSEIKKNTCNLDSDLKSIDINEPLSTENVEHNNIDICKSSNNSSSVHLKPQEEILSTVEVDNTDISCDKTSTEKENKTINPEMSNSENASTELSLSSKQDEKYISESKIDPLVNDLVDKKQELSTEHSRKSVENDDLTKNIDVNLNTEKETTRIIQQKDTLSIVEHSVTEIKEETAANVPEITSHNIANVLPINIDSHETTVFYKTETNESLDIKKTEENTAEKRPASPAPALIKDSEKVIKVCDDNEFKANQVEVSEKEVVAAKKRSESPILTNETEEITDDKSETLSETLDSLTTLIDNKSDESDDQAVTVKNDQSSTVNNAQISDANLNPINEEYSENDAVTTEENESVSPKEQTSTTEDKILVPKENIQVTSNTENEIVTSVDEMSDTTDDRILKSAENKNKSEEVTSVEKNKVLQTTSTIKDKTGVSPEQEKENSFNSEVVISKSTEDEITSTVEISNEKGKIDQKNTEDLPQEITSINTKENSETSSSAIVSKKLDTGISETIKHQETDSNTTVKNISKLDIDEAKEKFTVNIENVHSDNVSESNVETTSGVDIAKSYDIKKPDDNKLCVVKTDDSLLNREKDLQEQEYENKIKSTSFHSQASSVIEKLKDGLPVSEKEQSTISPESRSNDEENLSTIKEEAMITDSASESKIQENNAVTPDKSTTDVASSSESKDVENILTETSITDPTSKIQENSAVLVDESIIVVIPEAKSIINDSKNESQMQECNTVTMDESKINVTAKFESKEVENTPTIKENSTVSTSDPEMQEHNVVAADESTIDITSVSQTEDVENIPILDTVSDPVRESKVQENNEIVADESMKDATSVSESKDSENVSMITTISNVANEFDKQEINASAEDESLKNVTPMSDTKDVKNVTAGTEIFDPVSESKMQESNAASADEPLIDVTQVSESKDVDNTPTDIEITIPVHKSEMQENNKVSADESVKDTTLVPEPKDVKNVTLDTKITDLVSESQMQENTAVVADELLMDATAISESKDEENVTPETTISATASKSDNQENIAVTDESVSELKEDFENVPTDTRNTGLADESVMQENNAVTADELIVDVTPVSESKEVENVPVEATISDSASVSDNQKSNVVTTDESTPISEPKEVKNMSMETINDLSSKSNKQERNTVAADVPVKDVKPVSESKAVENAPTEATIIDPVSESEKQENNAVVVDEPIVDATLVSESKDAENLQMEAKISHPAREPGMQESYVVATNESTPVSEPKDVKNISIETEQESSKDAAIKNVTSVSESKDVENTQTEATDKQENSAIAADDSMVNLTQVSKSTDAENVTTEVKMTNPACKSHVQENSAVTTDVPTTDVTEKTKSSDTETGEKTEFVDVTTVSVSQENKKDKLETTAKEIQIKIREDSKTVHNTEFKKESSKLETSKSEETENKNINSRVLDETESKIERRDVILEKDVNKATNIVENDNVVNLIIKNTNTITQSNSKIDKMQESSVELNKAKSLTIENIDSKTSTETETKKNADITVCITAEIKTDINKEIADPNINKNEEFVNQIVINEISSTKTEEMKNLLKNVTNTAQVEQNISKIEKTVPLVTENMSHKNDDSDNNDLKTKQIKLSEKGITKSPKKLSTSSEELPVVKTKVMSDNEPSETTKDVNPEKILKIREELPCKDEIAHTDSSTDVTLNTSADNKKQYSSTLKAPILNETVDSVHDVKEGKQDTRNNLQLVESNYITAENSIECLKASIEKIGKCTLIERKPNTAKQDMKKQNTDKRVLEKVTDVVQKQFVKDTTDKNSQSTAAKSNEITEPDVKKVKQDKKNIENSTEKADKSDAKTSNDYHEGETITKISDVKEKSKSDSVFDKLTEVRDKLTVAEGAQSDNKKIHKVVTPSVKEIHSNKTDKDSSDDDMIDSCGFDQGNDCNDDSDNEEDDNISNKIKVNEEKLNHSEIKIQGTKSKIILKDINTLIDDKHKNLYDPSESKTIVNTTEIEKKKSVNDDYGPISKIAPQSKKLQKFDLVDDLVKEKTDENTSNKVLQKKSKMKLRDVKQDNKVPILTCVDITKLQAKSTPKLENKTIVNLKQADTSLPKSLESIGVENEDSSDVIDVPETDPLALAEEEILMSKKLEEESVKNKPRGLSLAAFKLDDTEEADTSALIPEPIARALRNRKISVQVAKNVTRKRSSDGAVDSSGGKKRRGRGRPRGNFGNRVIEIKGNSSSEEENEKPLVPVVKVVTPQRGTGKARRGRGRGRGRGSAQAHIERVANESPVLSSDPQSETSRAEVTASPLEQKTPTGRRKRRVLGLDIDPTVIIQPEGTNKDSEEHITRSSVRQSRRIAQIKIKEEAERRKIEELTHVDVEHKKKKKKDYDKDFRIDSKKKKSKEITEDEEDSEEVVEISSKRKHKKRRHQDLRKLFNTSNPWQSSSESSSNEEEEEEEVEEEPSDEEPAVLKSDHEFSPESDLENNAEVQPLRRARTVKKESDTDEPTDEHACQKCGKADHPEWILLCDKCDCGWHCSCLRPALLVIPEGDWFCPPCQHITLVEALKVQLIDYDKKLNRREMEVRRKQRLAYVGISLDNVLPSKESEGPKPETENNQDERASRDESSDSESDSESGSSSGDESEPIYQLRQRRQAHSYRFNDYDELINSAIQDEMESVKGAGNQGRGKDIATIVNAEKEEAKALLEQQNVQEPEVEQPPPVVPVLKEKSEREPEVSEDSSEDDRPRVVPKHSGRKKHRKLNSLDISSEDDADDDEDFKGTSASEEEDIEDLGSEDSEELDYRRGKGRSGPTRRSTRARMTRFDKDFINDDSEDEAPRRKKTKSIWDESESEESDKSWGRRKKSKKQRQFPTPKSSKKSRKKKRRRSNDSDPDVRKPKKPKIKYGGLEDSDDEEFQTRRTRGRKINYIDALGSDSDEDKKRKTVKPIESEDEYVANEDDEDLEEAEAVGVVEDEEKDSDSDSVDERPPLQRKIIKIIAPSKVLKGRGKAGIPRPEHLKQVTPPVIPEPQPEQITKTSEDVVNEEEEEEEEEDEEEEEEEEEEESEPRAPVDIPVIAANPGNLNEEEVETMMMENEEYAKKQLELMAIQLAKEKKKKEKEAKKVIEKKEVIMPPVAATFPAISPPTQPKKRGRKSKSELEAIAAAKAAQEALSVSPVAMNPALVQTPDSASKIIPPNPDMNIPSAEIPAIVPTVVSDLSNSPPKRRGRGKGKKTLAAQAAATVGESPPSAQVPPEIVTAPVVIPPPASSVINSTTSPLNLNTMSNINIPTSTQNDPQNLSPNSNLHVGKLGIAAPPQPFSQNQPTPSVITRMLQSQPMSAQTFTTSANAMNQKYFPPGMSPEQQPPRGSPTGQFPPVAGRGRVPSPYRQSPPAMGMYPGVRPMAPNSPHRLRSPGPPNMQMFHSTHHSMDPSPSGGGPINIAPPNRDRNSPGNVGSPMTSKEGPTPPPPPYSRAMTANRFSPNESSPGPSLPPPIRHHMFPQATAHMQQPSPPPRPPPPGNFSPYHPPPPPNYHYGAYPPAPSLAAADDALPPTDYQGSPYPEQYNTADGTVHSSEGSNSKPFDEEGSGEFGGLVSYFSSQREDDLDT